jgi:hypothetical protein
LLRQVKSLDRKGVVQPDPGLKIVIKSGVEWLARAQDCSRTNDGGVARHFSLIDGWAPSYPETTGYIVATLIAHGAASGCSAPIERAKRMLDWLVDIQFPEGGYQGGTVDQLPRVPVTFNTGQILIGLAAGAHLDTRYHGACKPPTGWFAIKIEMAVGVGTPRLSRAVKRRMTHVSAILFLAHQVEPHRPATHERPC